MGIVVSFRRHAGNSADIDGSGRGTSDGHGASAGHCSENQRRTSSYLRAVKVFSASSKRSKKRQSPAAKRPSVATLTERAEQYAEAQAMRFERSSDSIDAQHSRKIPTTQAVSVGKFRLAESPQQSDKSAMGTVDQIRQRLERAMKAKGEGPVAAAVGMGLERNCIRDFLTGKKQSLKTEVMLSLSERYRIPFKELVITKEKPQSRRAAS